MTSPIWIFAAAGGAYVAWKAFNIFQDKKFELSEKGKDTSITNVAKQSIVEAASVQERFPRKHEDLSGKAFGGQPMFFNEADCSRGRFLGWIRTDMDRADRRKVENGFYRARITQDVKYFWFFPGSKEILTPCVFRPGIDAITYGPGEMDGVPPEGMIILKRSLCGQKLAVSVTERYRALLMDEKHKNNILSDMLIAVKDKERLQGLDDSSKEATDEVEKRLKRTKKLHDAAAGRGGGEFPGGNPYGQEMYGGEGLDDVGAGGPGGDTLWKFEQ